MGREQTGGGLFKLNFEILRGNARRGNAPPRRQGFIPPYPYGGRCGVSEDFRLSDSKTIPFGRARYPPPVGPEIKHLLPFIAAMYRSAHRPREARMFHLRWPPM